VFFPEKSQDILLSAEPCRCSGSTASGAQQQSARCG
jgi:hypothetical protein